MTAPTLTCETCEDPIDVATDPRCIQDGGMDVMCADCRERAFNNWMESLAAGEGHPSLAEQHREAYKIKRGWSA